MHHKTRPMIKNGHKIKILVFKWFTVGDKQFCGAIIIELLLSKKIKHTHTHTKNNDCTVENTRCPVKINF
jgi:hypothetical protein